MFLGLVTSYILAPFSLMTKAAIFLRKDHQNRLDQLTKSWHLQTCYREEIPSENHPNLRKTVLRKYHLPF